ncbi:hypothetical protein BDB01DRAFT_231340 [Pilobolus umbonatus]|nr:hypothetical protein BDB01DRAFT_231340 [Pilobolus umbonatus]
MTELLDPLVTHTFLVSISIFLTWFTVWNRRQWARTEKERAYVCTLLSSCVTTSCSIPLVYRIIVNGGDLSEIVEYRPWTVRATVFFMSFLLLDLILGVIFYRKRIGLLTGWIHHISYLCVLTWAIHNRFCGVFIMMCLLELPTFLLALGSIRSHLRRDYLFATAFFSTRITFHIYSIICAHKLMPFGPIMKALFIFFPVHCFWFMGFIKQQLRLSKKIEKTEVVEEKKDVVQLSIRKRPTKVYSKPSQQYTSRYISTFHQSSTISVH